MNDDPIKTGSDFDDFVRESATPLLRAAVIMTGDRQQAEDIVQVALLRTARHWSKARAAPGADARKVLVNLTKDNWRRRTRRPETLSTDPGLLDRPSRDLHSAVLDRDEVSRALALLPVDLRAVLVLRFLEDLSVSEVAAILDCPEGTVRSHTHRALDRLRTRLSINLLDMEESDVRR